MTALPKVSRSVVLREFGGPVSVEEIDIPELEPGAILVRVDAATVCGTDVHIRSGSLPAARLPLILGHESTGTIVATNSRERDSNDEPIGPGDRIIFAYPWCGLCYWCTIARQPTMCESAQMYGWGPSDVHPYLTGTFAEYVYVKPVCKVLKVPQHLDPAVVASASCALRSVMHGFERLGTQGPILPSDTVVVLGSGAVGLYATAVALTSGAGQVLLVGAPKDRLDIGTGWGAAAAVDITTTTADHRRELVLNSTSGRGADIVIDCAGPVSAFQEALELTRKGGRVLEIGIGSTGDVAVHPYFFNIKMISVIGSLSGDIAHFDRALKFIIRHETDFDFGALTNGVFSLDTVDDALSAVETQNLIKPRIVP